MAGDVSLDPLFEAFGVSAAVTLPEAADAIPATGVWVQVVPDQFPVGRDLQRREPRKVLALRRAEVPTLPRGTLIVAVPFGGEAPRTWKVDGIDHTEADEWRAIVVPVPD